MTDHAWIGVTLSEQRVAELTARYEVLREQALEHHPEGVRHGLALLLRQGVAAWTHVSCEIVTAPVPDAGSTSPIGTQSRSLPSGTTAEVVHVLAAMALQHVEEVQV